MGSTHTRAQHQRVSCKHPISPDCLACIKSGNSLRNRLVTVSMRLHDQKTRRRVGQPSHRFGLQMMLLADLFPYSRLLDLNTLQFGCYSE